MRVIKRKILIEDLISRVDDVTYGTVTASTIYLPIFITHTIDDMGIFTDMEFSGSSATPPILDDNHNVREIGAEASDFYYFGGLLTGFSSSRLGECKNYGLVEYTPGFDVETVEYENYNGVMVDGRTRVFDYQSGGTTTYTIKGDINDPNFGTPNQASGVYLEDNVNKSRTIINEFGQQDVIIETKFTVFNEGSNQTNTSLSAITKLEEYLGVVLQPEIQSDVFIERGVNIILEPHLKLSEIESIDHLERFGNGYYNIVKQTM